MIYLGLHIPDIVLSSCLNLLKWDYVYIRNICI